METLEKLIYDLYKKNARQCTDEEIYNALLIYTKNQLFERGYQDGKKKIYYISAEFLIDDLHDLIIEVFPQNAFTGGIIKVFHVGYGKRPDQIGIRRFVQHFQQSAEVMNLSQRPDIERRTLFDIQRQLADHLVVILIIKSADAGHNLLDLAHHDAVVIKLISTGTGIP